MTILKASQAARNAAAAFYGPHLARPGEVPVTAHMRAGKIDESPLVQAFEKAIRDERERCAGIAAEHAQKARERVAACRNWSPAQAEHSRARDLGLDIEEAIRAAPLDQGATR